MNLEDFFNQHNVIGLSFFKFRNAITAAYFANKDLEILLINENFRSFFPVLGNVTNAYFPDVLEQLGVRARRSRILSRTLTARGPFRFPRFISALMARTMSTPCYQRALMTTHFPILMAYKASSLIEQPSGT